MRVLKVFILFILLISFVCAQEDIPEGNELAKVGTAGAQFLKFPVGARGAALGNALVLKVRDASAVFWNPAGLAHITEGSIFYSHSILYMDMNFGGLSMVYTIPTIGNLGVNFVYFGSGEIEETTVEYQDGTGSMFSYTDMAIGASYARALTNRFSIGFNLRYIQENLTAGLTDEHKASNWAADIGVLYFTDFKGLTVGMSIRNFGPQLQPSGTYRDWDKIILQCQILN